MRNPKGLRLYKVVTSTMVLYFDNIREAKAARDSELDGGQESAVVNRGPDHRRGETGL